MRCVASSTKVALTASALRMAMQILRGVFLRGSERNEGRAGRTRQQHEKGNARGGSKHTTKEKSKMSGKDQKPSGVSRRTLLRTGAGLAGGVLLPAAVRPAFAVGEYPPIGTYPAGSQGDTVNIAASVPRTGTYAVQGEDELKGWQLAVGPLNNGDP